jgi:hypothetical protein
MRRALATAGLLVLAYLGLALLLTWPLAVHLTDSLLGTPAMDQVDTAWLRLAAARWLTGQEPGVFAPFGYDLVQVLPNLADHLLGAPLALVLPWPLADNLWWIAVLAADGLAAHLLGRQVGGGHGAGFLSGVAFVASEPLLREVNLSHAPQALLFAAPLFLAALLRTLAREGRPRHAAAAGALLALSAACYWYQALFLVVVAIPPVLAVLPRVRGERALLGRLARVVAVAAALTAPLLAWTLHGTGPLSGLAAGGSAHLPGAGVPGLPPEHAWTFLHSGDLLWPLRLGPARLASRVSLGLLAAVFVGARSHRGTRWPWVAAALLVGVALMGPFLQFAGEPLRLGGHLLPLPALLLERLSAGYARLHWPLRWGLVLPLALIPLAARAARPALWAAAILLECLVLSPNFPLDRRDVAGFAGWRALSSAPGPVLVLSQERGGDGPASMGLIFRASGAPLANEVGVPPRAAQPLAFRRWQEGLAVVQWWRAVQAGRAGNLAAGAVAEARTAGIAAIALDLTPGGERSAAERAALAAAADAALGPGEDQGCARIWWLR